MQVAAVLTYWFIGAVCQIMAGAIPLGRQNHSANSSASRDESLYVVLRGVQQNPRDVVNFHTDATKLLMGMR